MHSLITEIKQCTLCSPHLELGPNPILSVSPKSKVVIIGQAPGVVVHASGIPWNDQSGDRLRKWMGVSKYAFYDADVFALLPMGFCYPGKGKSGDLPPRPECAPKWHERVLAQMTDVSLILLIGKYAQDYYLKPSVKRSLTETVKNHRDYLPNYLPLPHPSPRNNIWLKKNPWFEASVIPTLQQTISTICADRA